MIKVNDIEKFYESEEATKEKQDNHFKKNKHDSNKGVDSNEVN